MAPPFASGVVFLSAMLDRLTVQCFYNRDLLAILQAPLVNIYIYIYIYYIYMLLLLCRYVAKYYFSFAILRRLI